MNKRVVYTSLFGLYENIYKPEFVFDDCDYFVFSNFETYGVPTSGHAKPPWQIKTAPVVDTLFIEECSKSRFAARNFKMRPFFYLPNYETYIWQDSNVQFKEVGLLEQLGDGDIAIFPHQKRSTLEEELEACIKYYPEEGIQLMRNQVQFYLDDGFPKDYPLFETGVIISNKNDKTVRLFDMWWNELKKWTNRDQLSLGYCLWKCDINFTFLSPGYVRNNPYFVVHNT